MLHGREVFSIKYYLNFHDIDNQIKPNTLFRYASISCFQAASKLLSQSYFFRSAVYTVSTVSTVNSVNSVNSVKTVNSVNSVKEEDEVVRHLRQRLGVLIVRDNAMMMASRHPTFAPPDVDGDNED